MTGISKRLIAFKLALIMFISVVPFGIFGTTDVLANSTLGITDVQRDGDHYDFIIAWDDIAQPEDSSGSWDAMGFSIFYQNLSREETLFEELEDFDPPLAQNIPADQTAFTVINYHLEPASIYRFVVVGRFERTVDGSDLTEVMDISQEIIFLTHIPLEATSIDGYTDRFLLEWTIPRVEAIGTTQPDLFDTFMLHAGLIDRAMNWTFFEEVSLGMLDINMVDGRPRARYEWVDAGFEAGHLYGMYIEPMRVGTETIHLINAHMQIPQTTIPVDPTSINRIFSRSFELYTYFGAFISPILNLNVHDLTTLALEWERIGSSQPDLDSSILQLQLFRRLIAPNGSPTEQPIVAFLGTQAVTNTRFLESPVPETQANYWFTITYNDIRFDFNHPLNHPSGNDVTLLGPTMTSTIAVFNPWMTEFTPYIPHIHQITDNGQDPFTMDITWEAFLRDPITEDELVTLPFGRYLDRNITYQLLVTDDRTLFPSIPDDMAIELDASTLDVQNMSGVAHFGTTVDSFITFEDGEFVERPLQENTIYYVRIIATRNESGEDSYPFESDPAYGAHFIIPINNIPTEPNMLSRPPLRVQVINGVPQITEDSITIEWEEQWFEVYDETSGIWHSGAALTEGPNGWELVFGENINAQNNILMTSREYNPNGSLNIASSRQRIAELIAPHVLIPVIRLIDLTGVDYQVHTVLFENAQLLGFENYLNIINSPDGADSWVNITPIGSGTLEHTVTTSQNPEGPLQPDTAYIIFIRPFEGSETGDRIAFYPNFVSATTIEPRPPVDVTPIVPIIQPVEYGDTYLTVRWEHIASLYYELRFSEDVNDYSEGGILIDSETIREEGIIIHIDGRDYIEFTITNLFPNSPHYIWVRSLIINDGAIAAISAWSNFIEMITLPLRPPQPPRGLGLASRGSLDIFNRENDTTHIPVGPNHMIVEWMRDPNDNAPVIGTTGADGDLAQPLYSTNIQNSFMLRFNDLIANRRYHIRARTTVVITRGGGNEVIREFIYTIQLSANGEFTDVIEINMQGEIPEGSFTQVAIMHSDWVQVSIFTGMTDEEFDGNIDPEMVPLPESDFEIIFNHVTNTLTYRFRSNQVDVNGDRDNNVDQRFISRLVSQRVFLHEVDVSRYNNRVVDNRIIEIPFVIIEAFVERQIDLKVIAENLSVTIPHGSIITNDVKALPGLTRTTRVIINISMQQNPTSNTISIPHSVSIQFIEGTNSVTVSEFERPLLISMSIPSTTDMLINNVGGYINNLNSGGWQRLNSTHNPVENAISFAVHQSGTYAVKTSTGATSIGTTNATLAHMHRVNSNLHITDLTVFDENATIHANQFNQIIAAIARRATTVEMNVPLSNDYFVTLGRSGMLVSGETVTRQAGIASLIRLYEVRTGYPITFFSPLEQTGIPDIASANEQFQTGLLKAESLGFFRGNTADPHGFLTMGDLMFILDIIFTV